MPSGKRSATRHRWRRAWPSPAQRPQAAQRAARRAPAAAHARRRPADRRRPVQARSALDAVIPLLALALGAVATLAVVRRSSAAGEDAPPSTTRILFPFVGAELSERALEAALRLARAERATVVPAYLVSVPLPLTLDAPAPAPRQMRPRIDRR